jgi:DNA-binding transcriptional LysR family regulator
MLFTTGLLLQRWASVPMETSASSQSRMKRRITEKRSLSTAPPKVPENEYVSRIPGQFPTPRLTLRNVNYFIQAANQQSVIRAAETLNISPAAVSGAIACLEKFMAAPLFVRRHARGLVLTDFGNKFLIEARALLAQANDLERLSQAQPARQVRSLTIGCLGDIAAYILPPLVSDFTRLVPDTEVSWVTAEHGMLIERLSDGTIDLALFLDFERMPSFVATELRSTPAQCVLAPRHPLARRRTIALASLVDEPFILLDIPKTRDYFLSIFASVGIEPRIVHRARSAEMVRSMVANGFGYSLLNFWPPGQGTAPHTPVYRPIADDIPQAHLIAARPLKCRSPQLIQSFLRHAVPLIRSIPFAAAVIE